MVEGSSCDTIRCPYCNRRYFPSEIFIPKNFLGTAVSLDDVSYFGDRMDLAETYTCDTCDNIFEITAEVSFLVTRSKVENFKDSF